MTVDAMPGPPRPGPIRALLIWWGDRPVTQLGLLAGTLLIFAFFTRNVGHNLAQFGINPGFAFLHRPAGFEIGESLIAYGGRDSYGRAILAGLLNTIAVASVGCVLATILGVALGVARLSGNLLLSGLVQAYVELMRNTPLLLQLFFWSATIHALPGPRQALQPLGGVFLTNRGIFLPAPGDPAAMAGLVAALVLPLAAAGMTTGLIRRYGRPLSGRADAGLFGLALLVGLAGLALLPHPALDWPELAGFNFAGGVSLSPEYAALLIGLVANAAALIAEIVRGGIQAVAAGQIDAARSLGLSRWQAMRLVLLPQALRQILPLLTASYLSLTKNSSLAVAIGFPDLVSVLNTTANQTGQVIETIMILTGLYLALNLSVSLLLNRYNQRLARQGYRA